MKKILVTGATGFIGSKIVDKLIENGKEVICLVRENSKRLKTLKNKNIDIIQCDLDKIKNLPGLLEGKEVDTVYHFAWQGVSDNDLKDYNVQLQNIRSTLDLISICPKIGCTRFIGAGSLHEFEGYYEMLEDKVVTNLGFAYKSSKLCAHWIAKSIAGNNGVDFFWPIISNTYGAGENSGRLINTIIRNIFNNKSTNLSEGKQNYDFIYIDDVVNAFYLIGEKGINGNNYYIGSGDVKPLKSYLQIVGNIANEKNSSNISLNFGEIKSNIVFLPKEVFDISNLTNDTGWKQTISFEEGIQKTVDWIWENR